MITRIKVFILFSDRLMMSEDSIVVNYQLRNIHYSITVNKEQLQGTHKVLILVEDKSTADQWKGTFDKQCKKLTHPSLPHTCIYTDLLMLLSVVNISTFISVITDGVIFLLL